MSWEQVASGSSLDLANIDQFESEFPEGSKGLLTLYCRADISQTLIDELNGLFQEQGVTAYAEAGSPVVNIFFQKGFPWLAVIAAAVLGLIALAILIVSWRLFKEVPAAIIPVSLWAVAAISAAVVLGIALVKGASIKEAVVGRR